MDLGCNAPTNDEQQPRSHANSDGEFASNSKKIQTYRFIKFFFFNVLFSFLLGIIKSGLCQQTDQIIFSIVLAKKKILLGWVRG
jgi:hypothetical protein